jgi:hypothetical protein
VFVSVSLCVRVYRGGVVRQFLVVASLLGKGGGCVCLCVCVSVCACVLGAWWVVVEC